MVRQDLLCAAAAVRAEQERSLGHVRTAEALVTLCATGMYHWVLGWSCVFADGGQVRAGCRRFFCSVVRLDAVTAVFSLL
jgi:hypothetical protein